MDLSGRWLRWEKQAGTCDVLYCAGSLVSYKLTERCKLKRVLEIGRELLVEFGPELARIWPVESLSCK